MYGGFLAGRCIEEGEREGEAYNDLTVVGENGGLLVA
jgi:hypothetical protein